MAVALLALISAIVYGLWQRDRRERSAVAGTSVSASPIASTSVQNERAPGTWRYVGPPELRPLYDEERRCIGGDEGACTRFLSACSAAGAYPIRSDAPNRNRSREDLCRYSYSILKGRCDANEVAACAELAKTSIRMQKRACELGHAPSCAKLRRPSFDAEEAAARERLRCETGDGAACVHLAKEREAQRPTDTEGVNELLREGCRHGYRPACDAAEERATRPLRRGQQECDEGSYEACLELARYYGLSNKDAPRAEELVRKAIAILERSCGKDDRKACRELNMLLAERGGTQATLGRTWLDAACRGGDELSCWALAQHFSVAFGRPKNQDRDLGEQYYALAMPLSEAACERGNAEACERAALGYGAGFGKPIDRAKADTLLARAIELAKRGAQ